MSHNTAHSIVADIGGTNTRVALAVGTSVNADSVQKFRNADYPNLETVLSAYLTAQPGAKCDSLCVAVAGPVRENVGELTNRDWKFDTDTLGKATGANRIAILNDLQAQGHALPYISDANLQKVVSGTSGKSGATQLVIGVGTGFNAAPVYNTKNGAVIPPSESGHTSLPIKTPQDQRLGQFIEETHGFAAVEEVLSGRGLEHLYQWLGQEDDDPRALSSTDIMAGASDKSDPRALATIEYFVTMLGRVAGDLSLIQLPFGGVYLIGGMARAVAPYFETFGFAEAFRDKGRFSDFMNQFQVFVVEDDFAALTGCASHLNGSSA